MIKKNIPTISDSEFEVMKIIWNTNPVKSSDIIKVLSSEKNWSESTIKTLINRLLKKESISYNKEGKTYLYYPLIDEHSYIKKESKSFLQKFYAGSLNNMLSFFIQDEKLDSKDIENLKSLLQQDEEKTNV